MIFDDFKKNPQQELESLYKFLGIETFEAVVKSRNKGGLPKSKLLSFLKFRPLIEIAKGVIPNSAHTKIDNFIKDKFFQKTKLSMSKNRELANLFHSDVKSIGDLLNRDLCQEWLSIEEKE